MIKNPISLNAARFPEAEALCWSGRSLSWQQLEECVRATARQLKEIGVGRGTRVCIAAHNSVSYAVLLYVLWELGASAVLADVSLSPEKMGRIAETSGSKMVFTEPVFRKAFLKKTRMIADVAAFDPRGSFFDAGAVKLSDIAADAEAVVMMEDALVAHDFKFMYDNALVAADLMPSVERGPFFLTSPLSSMPGLSVLFLSLVSARAVVISP